ncbi:hypothetical protein [Clavibacter sp. Sh2088]|uniref:hypothetical protein n=1 Tax=Clavibacter sp. Sh2088 TaxID=3397676 RepID=UPI0039DF86CE
MQHRTTRRAPAIARPALALGALTAIVAGLVAGPIAFHAASATAPASAAHVRDPYIGCIGEPLGQPNPPICRSHG